jgi:NitT/TauT family transport system substrate-binding protein
VRRAFAVCVLAALAAWAHPAAADDNLTVIGIVPTSFYEVLHDVAEHAGLFRAEHLNVDFQFAGNPAVAVQAVAAGKGDIASINIDGIMTGYARGVRMVDFLSKGPRFQDVLGVLDTSPIRTLGDLKGKTIGETSIGQPGEVFTRVLLAGGGLRPGDYSFAPIGIGAVALAAVETGKVDALVQPYPQQRIYEVTGHVKFRYFRNSLLDDVPNNGFVATPATLANKADQLRRFCRAIVEAAVIVRENPQLAAKYFVMDSGGKVTDQAIADEVRLLNVSQDLLAGFDPTSKRIGSVPLRAMAVYAKFMADNGLTPAPVPLAAVFTNAFVDYANDFDHEALIAQAKAMR